jgi:TonB family protein
VQNECCSAEKDDDNKVHLVVENLPQFPGGMPAMGDYLRNEIRYPKKCVEQKIEGRSIITFVVGKNGKISKVKVLRSAGNKLLDKEAKRAVKSMPRWQPGTHKGKVVKVQMTLPVLFKLQKK